MTVHQSVIRIGVIDPSPVLRFALQCLTENSEDLTLVMSACDGREAFQAVLNEQPDVVLSEVDLDFRSVFDVMTDLRPRGVRTRFVLFTHDAPDVYIAQAMRTGVAGYLTKDESPERVAAAIRTVARGDHAFSSEIADRLTFDGAGGKPTPRFEDRLSQLGPRQLETARHLSRGYSVKEAARLMGVTEKSASSHQYRIYAQLGVHDKVSLSRLAAREGLIGLGTGAGSLPSAHQGSPS